MAHRIIKDQDAIDAEIEKFQDGIDQDLASILEDKIREAWLAGWLCLWTQRHALIHGCYGTRA